MFRSIRSLLGISGKKKPVQKVSHFFKSTRVKFDILEDRTVPAVALAYVDHAWASFTSGTLIADADPSTAGNQPAVFGENAFAGLQGGVGGVVPGGMIKVAAGSYAENIALSSPFTLNVSSGSATFSGVLSGASGLIKAGAGDLILTGMNTYTGDTTVSGGRLQVSNDSQLGVGGNVNVTSPGVLEITSDLTTSRSIFLNNNSTLQVDSGKTLSLSGADINGGVATGPGTIATTGALASSFTGVRTTSSLTLNANADTHFTNFDNGGALNLAAAKNFAMNFFTNTSSGKLSVGGAANVTDFVTNGQTTVASTGSLVNVGSSGLTFGGGSVTTVNRLGAANGIINMGSSDALLSGGYMVNQGVVGSYTPGVDFVVGFGSVAKGSGAYGSVITQNGGYFSPGNSPGTGTTQNYFINAGGSLGFEIANATGSEGTLSGWDLLQVKQDPNFPGTPTVTFGATSSVKYTIQVTTLLDSGLRDTPGPMANFNKDQNFFWRFMRADNTAPAPATTFVGNFDPAAFNIVTTNFGNPIAGVFSVEFRDTDNNGIRDSLFLVYTANAAGPTASNGTLAVQEDTPTTGTLVSTGSNLTFSIVTPPIVAQGTVAITNASSGAYSFTPAKDFNGPASFTFKSNNGTADSNVATISITVAAVNDAPVASDGTLTTSPNTAKTGTLVATDVDSATLTYSIVTAPTAAQGTVAITNVNTGAYSFTPTANFSGPATFTFRANDGSLNSNTATISITVSPANASPVASNGTLTTLEDTTATGTLVATDTDSPTLTYSIVTAPTAAQGTVTITNAATGAYTFTPATDFNGPASFTFRANDGSSNSNTATVSISVTPANDAPVASNGTLSATEDTVATGTLVTTDVDSATLTYSVVAQPTAAQGTVSITNAATGAYSFTPAANFNGTATFTFKANDGSLDSNVATVTVTVAAVNDAPVALAGSLSATEDTVATGTLVATDVDSATLTYSIVAQPAAGQGTVAITNAATGAYSFTPAANFNGTSTFTFKANDGTLDSNAATVTITVAGVNDAPVASNGTLSATEDTLATGTLVATDVDTPTLTYSIVSQPTPAQGTVTITNAATGAYSYAPPLNFNGTTSFTFRANDGSLNSNTATVTITVSGVNDAPVASNGALSTPANTAASGTLAATDVDSAALTYSIVTPPTAAQGTVAITNAATGAYSFTPATNFSGSTSFTFKANDGSLDSNVATVSITVGTLNASPVASNGSLTTLEDTPATGTLVATDSDSPTLTYSIVNQPAAGQGTVVITNAATGAYSFTPFLNFNGPTSFTFRASDGVNLSNTATVSITVISVDDPPVVFGTLTATEDTPTTGQLLASDVDGGTLTFTITSPMNPAQGTVTLTNTSTGAFSFVPAPNFNGLATFQFKANDGIMDSNIATFTITVVPVNDSPVASNGTLSVTEDTGGTGTLVATDADSPTLIFSVVDPTNAHGTVTITSPTTGAYSFTPALNFSGTASFTFKATDGNSDSNIATVTITVTPVNDAPVASNGTLNVNEDTVATSTLVATDVDSSALTYSIVTPPSAAQGVVAITNAATGAYSFTPAPNFNGPASFTFKANDGALDSNVATISITVGGVNDAPVASNGILNVIEDAAATGVLVATDVDSPTLTYSVVSPPSAAQGTVAITNAATGAYSFTPAPNFNGPASFTFKANDGALDSNVATITVTITAVNDPPVASPGVLSATEDTVATGTLVASDVDSPNLTYSIVSQPTAAQGTVAITNAATGAYSYTPAANFNGTATFTFKANDGSLDSNVATVTITVAAVNDAPVASNGILTVTEDTVATGTLVATDVDSPTLTYSIVTPPTAAQGTVTITNAATGAYSFAPALNFNGPASFTFRASDGSLNSNTATISFVVSAVNDAPVASAAAFTTSPGVAVSGALVATDVDNATLTYSIVTPPTAAQGVATITNPATGAFTFTPAAGFNGTATFTFKANDGALDSNIATVTITVSQTGTTTQLSSLPNPSTYGQQVTFSAVVTSTSGTPTGTVNFFDGANQIGSGTISGPGLVTFQISSLSAGTHVISAKYAGTATFSASTSNSINQVVNAKALTVTGITVANKVYDGRTTATINTVAATLNGVVAGDSVTLNANNALGTFDSKNVGSRTVTISGLTLGGTAAANYTLTAPTVTATIAPKIISINGVAADNKVYDGTTAATFTVIGKTNIVGIVAGDHVNYSIASAVATFADPNVGNGKTVTLTGVILSTPPSFNNDAANYVVAPITLSANITPRPLTITANNRTKTVSQAVTFAGTEFTSSGLAAGQTIGSATITSTGAPANTPVGSYDILISAPTGGTFNPNNYTITFVKGTMTVTP